MKKIIFFLIGIIVFASEIEELFKNKEYTKICKKRWDYINKYKDKNEKLLSLVAYSCLQFNYITPALDVAKAMHITKEGRDNAIYISTLFTIKKLIISLIKDNLNISYLRLPILKDNSLGKAFYLIQKNGFKREESKIVTTDGIYTYKLWLSNDYNIILMVYKNNKQIKMEYYW
jgi:hypothetical protein